jgi:hypothetical protein
MSYDDLPKTTKLDPPPPNPAPKKSGLPVWAMILGGVVLVCIVLGCVVSLMGRRLMQSPIVEQVLLTSTALSQDEPALQITPTTQPSLDDTPVAVAEPTATVSKGLGTSVPALATATSVSISESDAIVSTDGLYQITQPGPMTENNTLNSDATLQIANLILEQYLIVIPDNAQTLFDSGMTFEDYCDWIVDNFSSSLANSELSDLGTVTIDGFSAQRYQLAGQIDDLDVTYVLTMINGGATYYQVVAWTLTDVVDENMPVLITATDSFQSFRNDQGQDQQ